MASLLTPSFFVLSRQCLKMCVLGMVLMSVGGIMYAPSAQPQPVKWPQLIREVLHVEIRNLFDRLICRNSQSRISANERFCKQKIRFPSVAKQRKNGDVRFCQAETAEIWLRNIFLYQNDLHGPWRIWWTEKNKTSLLLFSCCLMMRVISTMMNFCNR